LERELTALDMVAFDIVRVFNLIGWN